MSTPTPTKENLEAAEQYELAAQILRDPTLKWTVEKPSAKAFPVGQNDAFGTSPIDYIRMGYSIRLKPLELLQPSHGLELHNPDNLTAEQVGKGYRLLCKTEMTNQPHEFWASAVESWLTTKEGKFNAGVYYATYRVPSTVPWPVVDKWAKEKEAFERGERIQLRNLKYGRIKWSFVSDPGWNDNLEGDEYRIAPPTIPLGPEDVPPGSVFRWKNSFRWINPVGVAEDGICVSTSDHVLSRITYQQLKDDNVEILRPGSTWMKCEKEAQQ